MASQHTVADDIVYDLVSIQYHALKGSELYDRFLQDAQHAGEHREVAQFFQECKRQDDERARQCHQLLAQLTGSGKGIR